MYFSMYWKLKFQISAHLKEKSRKIEKIFYGSQMFAENTLCNADKILKSFTTEHTFNETDQVLQNVKYWPNIATVGYFKTKLKFQFQHSLFR